MTLEGRGLSVVTTGGAVHSLDRSSGFPQRTVGAMQEGPGGRLWFAGMQGISAVPWRQLKRFLLGHGERPPFYSATAGEGLRTRECSTDGQPAMAVAPDGTLCFATVGGVACLEGGEPPLQPSVRRPVVLESVRADGAKVQLKRPLRFPARVRSLEFHYASLALSRLEDTAFEVWLEGLEARWQPVGDVRHVRYTHLPPGSFVFHVRSVAPDGHPFHDETSLPFTVLPPPWRSPWVMLLGAFILLGAGPSIYYYRVTALKRRRDELASLVEEQTRELRRTAAALECMTRQDPLTAIPNYRAFEEELERAWRNAIRHDCSVAVIMADIDFFKDFNDAFGHLHGDECLRRVAGALSACTHRPGDLVARYGGEEFVALLPATDLEGGVTLAESMRRAVEALRITSPRPDRYPFVTASFGVAVRKPRSTERSATVVHAADRALYRAKSAGRNRVETARDPADETTARYPAFTDTATD
ncbi:MAG TPA: diguanylate cyclase [Acidobacteria bacterium]|nr:diguanylate cyclase [Acidobacteriota bacterium]